MEVGFVDIGNLLRWRLKPAIRLRSLEDHMSTTGFEGIEHCT